MSKAAREWDHGAIERVRALREHLENFIVKDAAQSAAKVPPGTYTVHVGAWKPGDELALIGECCNITLRPNEAVTAMKSLGRI